MLDTFPAVKETKRNVGGRGSRDDFMGSGGECCEGERNGPPSHECVSKQRRCPFLPSSIPLPQLNICLAKKLFIILEIWMTSEVLQ